ncbi:VOC family protein [Massilia sp. W12]|uniref:VOC family protein n=1 Tax=Massilia sp. W12 TaxID=3126507 RepID=UPI0030D48211
MMLQGVHHVAYRCHDTRETVEFYQNMLDMEFLLAISEDRVPSTKEPDPYMHVFLDAGNGNVLAFFELPNSPRMGRDGNTPAWVQHIAFKVQDMPTLLAAKEKLEAAGIEVTGPTNHELFQSIYFLDPNGHRIELAADTTTPEVLRRMKEIAPQMLADWTASKRTVKHAAWLHEKEFSQ